MLESGGSAKSVIVSAYYLHNPEAIKLGVLSTDQEPQSGNSPLKPRTSKITLSNGNPGSKLVELALDRIKTSVVVKRVLQEGIGKWLD